MIITICDRCKKSIGEKEIAFNMMVGVYKMLALCNKCKKEFDSFMENKK